MIQDRHWNRRCWRASLSRSFCFPSINFKFFISLRKNLWTDKAASRMLKYDEMCLLVYFWLSWLAREASYFCDDWWLMCRNRSTSCGAPLRKSNLKTATSWTPPFSLFFCVIHKMLVAVVVVTVHDAMENRRTFGISLVFQLETTYVTTFYFPLRHPSGFIVYSYNAWHNISYNFFFREWFVVFFFCVGAIFDGIVNGSCAWRIFSDSLHHTVRWISDKYHHHLFLFLFLVKGSQ